MVSPIHQGKMRTCGDAFVKEGKARAGSPILNMEEHLPYRLHQSTKSTAESHYIRAGKASAVSPILDQEEHLRCRLYQSRKSTCGIAYIRAGRAPVGHCKCSNSEYYCLLKKEG